MHVKLMQNFKAAEKIMGITIETSGDGSKVDMNADYHGIVNFTRIEMDMSDNTDCTLQCLLDEAGMSADILIKNYCMQLVNRLAEVIRNATNNYWIRFVSLRDIMKFQIFDLSQDEQHRLVVISMNPGHGYNFRNFKVLEQKEVESEIDKTLREQSKIPFWKNLFLDSVNYFTIERYNEAVISANIALESFVAEHLFSLLNQKSPNRENENRDEILKLPKSLHKIMKNHFPAIDGRAFEANNLLWEKFDDARNSRARAMHSFTKRIPQEETFKIIQDIRQIILWIDPSVKLGQVN
jgi:hypothetical protein